MNLTQDDLKAIRDIVEDVVEAKIEDSKLQTAAGFAGVGKQFAKVYVRLDAMQTTIDELQADLGRTQQTVDRIERVQRAEVERDDRQDAAIKDIRRILHAA